MVTYRFQKHQKWLEYFYSSAFRFAGQLTDKDFKMPSNVKFLSWLPQNDLLAHNKTKLFITHGGMYGKDAWSKQYLLKYFFCFWTLILLHSANYCHRDVLMFFVQNASICKVDKNANKVYTDVSFRIAWSSIPGSTNAVCSIIRWSTK